MPVAARRVALLVLVLSLGAGLWLRAARLGELSFDTDEYVHVFAGQSLERGEGPYLPSGQQYRRSLPYMLLVAGSFRLFGVSEASARLPSVVLGVLLILAVYGVGRCWFGTWAGLAAAAMVALSPLMVEPARLCRMYTLFHLLYLGALFAYERAFEAPRMSRDGRWNWAIAAVLLGLASLRIHKLALVAGPALLAYWGLRALGNWRGWHALTFLLVVGTAAAALALGLVDVQELLRQVHRVPSWAEAQGGDLTYYLRAWAQDYAWLWWVVPAAAAFAIWRHGWLGVFVLCQWAVPFALYSMVPDWKVRRYVGHLFPLLALLLAPALAWAVQAPWRLARSQGGWLRRALGGLGTAAAVAGLALAFQPSLAGAVRLQEDVWRPRWRRAYAFVEKRWQPGDAVIASVPLSALYYLDEPATHAINEALFRDGEVIRDDVGDQVDSHSGASMVTSVEELEEAQREFPRGWLVLNRGRFRSDAATPPALRAYITRRFAAHHPIDGNATVYVFSWGTSDTATEPARQELVRR